MIKLYVTNSKYISLSELNLAKISPYRREKIERLARESSKRQSLAAGLLLAEIFPDAEIKFGEYGKPYIDGEHFNIAHSGDYVILAKSDKEEVGCDIERIKTADFEKIGRTVFHENEREMLKDSEDIKNDFFELWTKKEAFIKCIGEGFHFKPSAIDLTEQENSVRYNGKIFFFKEYMLSGYKIMLCSLDKEFPSELTETSFS